MNKTRIITGILAAFLVVVFVSGCGMADKLEDKIVEAKEKESTAEDVIIETVLPEGAPVMEGKGITLLGDQYAGYIDLPAEDNWEKMEISRELTDMEVSMQQASLDKYTIISIAAFQDDGRDAEDWAQTLAASLKNDEKVKDISGAMSTIGKYDAYQIFCEYPDTDQFFVVNIFRTDKDNYVHYVAAEFSYENAYVMDYLNTFHY